jgi:hypothetical protein
MVSIITPEANRLGVARILRTHIADYRKQFPLWPEHRKIVYDLSFVPQSPLPRMPAHAP